MTWIFGKKKRLLGRNSEGDVPLYINYYSGCSHGCLYCYSFRIAQRFAKTESPQELRKITYEDWINPVLEPIRENLENELKSNKWKREVFFQSASDSYAPHTDPKVTRHMLELLRKYDYPILVLTKNPKVLRDKDFFRDYRGNCRVGFTITVPEKHERVRRQIEPHSSSTKERIEALAELYSCGCQTTVSMEPLIPNIPIEDMLELMDTIRPMIYNVCFVGKLTFSSIPTQFRNHPVWKDIGKGIYDTYYEKLLKQLLPSIKRKYNIAMHTFEFCMEHKIKGREVSYNRLPKKDQKEVLALRSYSRTKRT